MPSEARNRWPKFFPSPVPTRSQEGSFFVLLPLGVESRPARGSDSAEARQRGYSGRWPCLRGAEDPCAQRAGDSWNSKHFNGGCSDPPHSTHGTQGVGGLRAAPLLRGKPNRTHSQGPAKATELQAQVSPGLSPTGSPPCWQHEGTKTSGLSWALRHQAEAESTPGGENLAEGQGCGSHGGHREGVLALRAAPLRRQHTRGSGVGGGSEADCWLVSTHSVW